MGLARLRPRQENIEFPERMRDPPERMTHSSDTTALEKKITYGFADLALISLGVLTVFTKSYETSLKAIDSAIYAGLSLTVTGQGLIPHLPTGLEIHGGIYADHGFNDHPVFLLYIVGWVMRLLGPEAWTARLVPCLMSAACIPVLYAIGRRLDSRLRAWIAGAILSLTILFFRNASGFQLDGPMTLFILLSFLAWMKKWPLRTGFFAGLAILTKAPVGLLVFPTMLVAEWFEAKREGRPFLRQNSFLKHWITALSFCLAIVAAYWALCAWIGGWNLVIDYWGRYVFGTLQGRDGSQPFDPFLLFKAMLQRYWPWLPFLVYAGVKIIRTGEWKERSELIPLAAMLIVVVIVSMIRFKSGAHYFLPAYPFFAWFAAKPIAEWLERRELSFLRGASVFVFITLLAALCFPIPFSREAFPALRKFNAFIQSEGTREDYVLYVNGEFPWGSFMDYIPEINFYTGRQVTVRDCADVSGIAQADPKIRWILVAGKNYDTCIDTPTRELFPTIYRSGKVLLLSRSPRKLEIDLTPLDRELKAALDGKPAPLPKDIYR